ncbi:hypothetical protein Pint_20944 [Pistacia integerrima]|uniref:Uncharacterized protein n=1 Tax=Pistacia integerrima TaxID=434235 RepID=A0ACC0XB78_9ROSI|nr:hypothetical protein Pint_20944 [Pistacia integerrima]
MYPLTRDKHQLLLDLRKAALEGDVTDKIMDKMKNNRNLLGAAITEEHETVFHIAAGAKQTHFVEQMIKLIGEEQKDYLKFQNKQCNTAFCFAAMAGSKEIAQAMLNEDESLLTIRGGKGMTPLYLATLFGQRETALFLYDEMKRQSKAQEQLKQHRKAIFYASVDSTLYDLALKLLNDDQENELAGACYMVDKTTMTALLRLAQTPLHLLDQTIESEETSLSNQALDALGKLQILG